MTRHVNIVFKEFQTHI